MLKRILPAAFLAVSSALAEPNAEPYPNPPSKKGLQVQMVDDALALGIKHAALNCHLASFVDLAHQPDSLKWPMDGQDYFFGKGAIGRPDGVISVCDVGAVHVSMAVYSV